MKLIDIGMIISPLNAATVALLQELEIVELRRKHEEEIAEAMGVPADILFNPYVQRLIDGPIEIGRIKKR